MNEFFKKYWSKRPVWYKVLIVIGAPLILIGGVAAVVGRGTRLFGGFVRSAGTPRFGRSNLSGRMEGLADGLEDAQELSQGIADRNEEAAGLADGLDRKLERLDEPIRRIDRIFDKIERRRRGTRE